MQQIEGFTADGDRYGIAFSAVADVADAGKICILEAPPPNHPWGVAPGPTPATERLLYSRELAPYWQSEPISCRHWAGL